jgi:3-deoxy-D-manno-octulosonic-acid transferase
MVLYYLGIRIYYKFILLWSIFNEKAKRFVKGRKDWQSTYQTVFKSVEKPVLWMHCASVGEFEQGRVLLEKLEDKKNEYFVLLTFFSPSGYELRKNYSYADIVLYLPIDIKGNAAVFLSIVKPSLALFVKYEIWLGYFNTLHQQAIPTYLICAKFRVNQIYFSKYGGIYKKALQNLTQIFIQTQEDESILRQNNIQNYTISGDLRYERVLEIKDTAFEHPVLNHFVNKDALTIIAGSTWGVDELVVLKCLKSLQENAINTQLIIAPHEVNEKHLKKILFLLGLLNFKHQLLSQYDLQITETQVLIVDSVGLLSKIYRYADMAYVGGGFGKGIHNTLEPAVYGIPVFFGPKNKKFAEAQWLKANTCGFEIENDPTMVSIILKLNSDKMVLKLIKEKLNSLFFANKNSSELIKKGIFKKRF